jgi:hypothetical protein
MLEHIAPSVTTEPIPPSPLAAAMSGSGIPNEVHRGKDIFPGLKIIVYELNAEISY